MLNSTDQTIRDYLYSMWSTHSNLVLSIIFKLLFACLIFKLFKYFINQITLERVITSHSSPQRIHTLSKVLKNALNYALYFIFTYTILSILGFPVATLVAGAGIASVALGMGAKEFVTDVINGFFILLERQFDVGDFIELPKHNIKGKIKEIGIRTSQIIKMDGSVYYIPNREISIVKNLSKENTTLIIELPINDWNQYSLISQSIFLQTQNIHSIYQNKIIGTPSIIGLTKQDNQQFSYTVLFEVIDKDCDQLKAKFYEHYLLALHELKI